MNDRVIIIGGGISGKLAGRVLSDYFREVLIIERDKEQETYGPRRGAPQGNHLHALLHAGEKGLERLFPGITESFCSSGAVKIDSTQDLAWFHHGAWKVRFPGPFSTILQTRPHLERHIEQYTKKISNITFLHNHTVKDYLFNKDRNQIYGIKSMDQNQRNHTYTADLVVDASGTGSITASWSAKKGIKIPAKKAHIGLTYISQLYSLPEKNRDWSIKIIYPNPPIEKMGGSISKVEDDQYIVTINGYLNEIPVKQGYKHKDAFINLAKKLPKLDIYQEIKQGVPVSEPAVYHIPHMHWKRFDKAKQLPMGLLLIGDTVCRIDPVFGQGMSIAVLEALALKKLLNQHPKASLSEITAKFHRKSAAIISPLWKMAELEDYRYPGISEKTTFSMKLRQWYVKNLYLVCSENKETYQKFVQVMNLTRPAFDLFHPAVIKNVFKYSSNRK